MVAGKDQPTQERLETPGQAEELNSFSSFVLGEESEDK
jgi:hypothetical protein